MRLSETELAATLSTHIDTRAGRVVVRERAAEQAFAASAYVSGRYRIVRFIARGGMGEVYEAEDLLLGERVALKAIRHGRASEDAIRHFRNEVQLARRVTHPNVCRIFDVGTHEGVDFLSMELLAGVTLSERLDACGRLAPEEALPLVEQIGAGLAAAHRLGIVHRDLKSHNVMLVPGPRGQGERAVITDFGLALHEDDGAATGEIAGSPAYMAPEQVVAGRVSAATDVYALGVVLFEMVTGKLPFVSASPMETAQLRLERPAPSPRTLVPELDRRWEKTILRCLERVPGDRYAGAAEVVGALRAPPRPRRRLRSWQAAALVLLLAAAIAGWVLWPRPARAPGLRTDPTLDVLMSRQIYLLDDSHATITDQQLKIAAGLGGFLAGTTRFERVPTGYTLAGVEPGSLARHLGFVDGDTITSVAGVPLDSPDAYHDKVRFRLAQAALARSTVDIEYTRDGNPRTLHVRVVPRQLGSGQP